MYQDGTEYIECPSCGAEWPAADIIYGTCPDCDDEEDFEDSDLTFDADMVY